MIEEILIEGLTLGMMGRNSGLNDTTQLISIDLGREAVKIHSDCLMESEKWPSE